MTRLCTPLTTPLILFVSFQSIFLFFSTIELIWFFFIKQNDEVLLSLNSVFQKKASKQIRALCPLGSLVNSMKNLHSLLLCREAFLIFEVLLGITFFSLMVLRKYKANEKDQTILQSDRKNKKSMLVSSTCFVFFFLLFDMVLIITCLFQSGVMVTVSIGCLSQYRDLTKFVIRILRDDILIFSCYSILTNTACLFYGCVAILISISFYLGCKFHILGLHEHQHELNSEHPDEIVEKSVDWSKVSSSGKEPTEGYDYVQLPKEAAEIAFNKTPQKINENEKNDKKKVEGDLLDENNESLMNSDDENEYTTLKRKE